MWFASCFIVRISVIFVKLSVKVKGWFTGTWRRWMW